MIVSINPTLFDTTEETVLQTLAQIISVFFEGKFIWDSDNVGEIFADNEPIKNTIFYKRFLSAFDQETLFSKKDEILGLSGYQTALHNKYLLSITIGFEENQIPPDVALRLLSTKAKIILENGTNDWNFILGVVKKYKRQSDRKNIYKIIANAIESENLQEENAGGRDGMIPAFRRLAARREYEGIAKFKIMGLFDSDRDRKDEIKNEQKIIIEFFKDRKISNENVQFDEDDIAVWHMLYKRAIENYLPVDVLNQYVPLPELLIEELEQLNAEQLDYYRYDIDGLKRQNINLKKDFPEVFLREWTRDKLEARCGHHLVNIELPNGTLVSISEIEQILLKICRIL